MKAIVKRISGREHEVVFPNGSTKEFSNREDAKHAARMFNNFKKRV